MIYQMLQRVKELDKAYAELLEYIFDINNDLSQSQINKGFNELSQLSGEARQIMYKLNKL